MKVNVLGFGLMAKQISALLSLGGFRVFIWNHQKAEIADLKRQIKIIKRATGLDGNGEVAFVEKLEDLEDNLTIESVIEDLDVKKSLFEKTRNNISNAYCTNSSSLAPGEIGDGVHGLHFFNPIHLGFVEYFEALSPSDDLCQLLDFLRDIKHDIISVHDNRGYLGNNVLFNEISAALKMVEKFNYDVNSISSFYNKFYDGRDVFTIIDLIGVDVVKAILVNLKEVDKTIYVPECLSVAISQNVLGKKNKTSIKQVLI
jgi:3-hydroxyacyl-CoA dehydrogenase